MTGTVKPADVGKRTYDSSGRQARAAEARTAILHAARETFLADGYAATTVSGVAAAASVSVETVYKAFGNKAGLVKAVFDVAVAGDDDPVPVLQREFVRSTIAEPDPRRKLSAYGAHLSAVAPRISPILLVVRDAAVSDAAAADVWAALQDERLTGMTAFATHLDQSGHLREDVTMEQARDVLWTHSSVEIWDLLVRQRGWSDERYGTWVGGQLIAALL
jgi:AcrR family transcriptional regulator